MRSKDLLFIAVAAVVVSPFFLSHHVYEAYEAANASHPYLLAFLKFAILATTGEAIGLRIKSGSYIEQGFGIVPRAVVWGILGVWIAAAMKIFASGVPIFAESLGVDGAREAMKGGFSLVKLADAFMISVAMNTMFAPIFMTLHKITDTHILDNGGSLTALVTPIPVRRIISSMNWDVQWNFVFKKTIPLFWIPAHTITFMLPPQFQVIFAAMLGVALGVLLSVAAVAGRK